MSTWDELIARQVAEVKRLIKDAFAVRPGGGRVPKPGSGDEGKVLTVVDGVPTWV